MKQIVGLLGLLLSFNFAKADADLVGPENSAVYCVGDYHVGLRSLYYKINPGQVKELWVDLGELCTDYLRPDVTIQIGVSFAHDPLWKKDKDNILAQGFSFQVIDAETGENLVTLAKSLGMPACNYGAGFIFTDLRNHPRVLRPVILRLKNNGRNAAGAAFNLYYDNAVSPSKCVDYPRSK